MTMAHVPGATYKVGTKDSERVYFDMYDGATGRFVFSMELTPTQARTLGQALLDDASKIDPHD